MGHQMGIDYARGPDFGIEMEASIREDRYIDIRQTIAGKASRMIIDTQEHFIREGLIKLGWTPPADG